MPNQVVSFYESLSQFNGYNNIFSNTMGHIWRERVIESKVYEIQWRLEAISKLPLVSVLDDIS